MKTLIAASVLFCSVSFAASAPVYNGVYWPAERVGQQVLLANNYHDIQVTAMQPRHCDDGKYDPNSVLFRAISSENHVVSGYTCGNSVYPTLTTVTEPKPMG